VPPSTVTFVLIARIPPEGIGEGPFAEDWFYPRVPVLALCSPTKSVNPGARIAGPGISDRVNGLRMRFRPNRKGLPDLAGRFSSIQSRNVCHERRNARLEPPYPRGDEVN
jgi:hypothetical protein